MLNRDLIIIIVGRLASAILTLIGIRVSTTLLDPSKYGHLAILLTIQSLCGLFFINPVGQYININTHKWWEKGILISKLKIYTKYVIVVGLIGSIISMVVNQDISTGMQIIEALAIFFMVIGATWNATVIPALNMVGYRMYFVQFSLITTFTSVFISCILTLRWPDSVSWMIGQSIGMIIGALVSTITIRRVQPLHNKFDCTPFIESKTILKYCIPLSLAMGFMWIQMSGYRFIIEEYWGVAYLGSMVVGLSLTNQIFSIAESIVTQFLYPLFFKKISETNDTEYQSKAYSDLINALMPMYVLLTAFVIGAAPHILKILVSSEYHEIVEFVVIGAIVELCRTISNLLSNAAQVTKKTISLTIPYALGGGVTILLLYCSAFYKLQIQYIAFIVLIGTVIMMITMWMLMQKQVKLKIDFKLIKISIVLSIILIYILKIISKDGGFIESILTLLVMMGIAIGFLIIIYKNSIIMKIFQK